MKLTRVALTTVLATGAPLAFAATRVGVGIRIGSPSPVVVHRAPPAYVVETVAPSPGPGYVWLPGRYTWTGGTWAWIPGSWVVPPRPDARWVGGSWNPQTQQWVEGHWEVPAPAPAGTQIVVPTPAPPVVMTAPAPAPTDYAVVILADPPPTPLAETRTPPPGPGYVWIDGYWGWENGQRQWFRGHWERPPNGYSVWVAPRWERRANGYAFIHGYWM